MNDPFDLEFLVRQAERTRPHRQAFYRRVMLGSMARVLEVGCGSGVIIGEIAQRCKAECVGIDPDEKLLRSANECYEEVQYKVGHGEHLPFPDASFDLVFTHFTLMWCKKPQQVLNEMYRVTAPGGWLATLAEPDYGGRVAYPVEVNPNAEEELLQQLGAETRLARQLDELHEPLSLVRSQSGVLGGSANTLQADGLVDQGARLVYIPVFWAWGKKQPSSH